MSAMRSLLNSTTAVAARPSRTLAPIRCPQCQFHTSSAANAPTRMKRSQRHVFAPTRVRTKRAPPPAETLIWLDRLRPVIVDEHEEYRKPAQQQKPQPKQQPVAQQQQKPSDKSKHAEPSATVNKSPHSQPAPVAPSSASAASTTTSAPASETNAQSITEAPASMSDGWDMTDEEFDRYLHSPMKSVPSYQEMEKQIDSLLLMEMNGVRMFPFYMRDQLKLQSLTFMQRVLAELIESKQPFTQHQLQSRLFTFLLKRASKLAVTEEERITILCPHAPVVGAKVPHPQWPEMTTVVRRYYTSSQTSYMSVPMPKPRAGDLKVRWSELVGATPDNPNIVVVNESDSTDAKVDDDDWIDVNQLDEEGLHFEGDENMIEALNKAQTPSQRELIQAQINAKKEMKDVLKARIQLLKRQVKGQLTEADRQELATMDSDITSCDPSDTIHELAVVYRFDGSGEEFEMRYPLTTKDVARMKLFEQDDDVETVIE